MCFRQFKERKYTSVINGTDVIVEGLKVNVFLKIAERLLLLKLRIDSEQSALETFVQDAGMDTDLKTAKLLYEYH